MKIFAIYDGTIQSKTVLQYGLRKVKDRGDELVVLHVFQGRLFLDYDAGPRAGEISRAEADRQRRDAEAIISGADSRGIAVRVLPEEGDSAEEVLSAAGREKADLILSPPRYRAIAKKASCPVYIIPGTILVPVDSSLKVNLDVIVDEAKAGGSKVLLLGVVPIHLYSAAEKEEMERVRKETVSASSRVRKELTTKGIDATEVLRSGYPDEVIMKAAEEFSASLIMLPSGGKTPSELTKAAAILTEEPDWMRKSVYLMPAIE